MDLVKALNSQYMKEELPEAKVGDTVRVHVRIKEGARERIQVFEGTVIARKHGGIGETVTVRRISYGVGCEKVFPLHSPNAAMIETVRLVQSGEWRWAVANALGTLLLCLAAAAAGVGLMWATA